MADRIFRLDRRELLAGLGAAVLGPVMPSPAVAQSRRALSLKAAVETPALRPGAPETAAWSLQGLPAQDFRFRRGETLEVQLSNELPTPTVPNWRGIDGAPATEPLTGRKALAPGAKDSFAVPLRHAGTFLGDLRLLGDGAAAPCRCRPLIVLENEAVTVDRDEVFLIEDWRLTSAGAAIAPGTDPKETTPLTTINGRSTQDILVRTHERLRLRLINGCQRLVIAIKIEGHDVRVMALDGQPAEPFLARNGAVVLAPGGRADVFIDAILGSGATSTILLHDGTEARPIARLVGSSEPPLRNSPLPPPPPLPSNGLPAQIELKNALRIDLALGGAQGDWRKPVDFAVSAAPAFRARAGRTVVLALTNRGTIAQVFHLGGHHFRLLDRLDDGWKPYWLDTLAIEPGQTQRIAFLAEYPGRYLIESVATDWAAPRLVRWYSVE